VCYIALHPSGQVLIAFVTTGRYSAHLRRQEADLRVFMDDETLTLDPHMDYGSIEGLSSEVRERLSHVRPTTMGAAKRMEGMTPTSAVALLRFAKRTHGRTWTNSDKEPPSLRVHVG
jgi:tRNA uridine 5-carboxymethylaminomethyl modification enzyme